MKLFNAKFNCRIVSSTEWMSSTWTKSEKTPYYQINVALNLVLPYRPISFLFVWFHYARHDLKLR